MIEIKKKSECCGCYACVNICPKKCIDMNVDDEGFWYPKVDKSLCINCNLCEGVCPTFRSIDKDEFKILAYACKNKNEEVRLNSSSGGVFTSLCEYVINNGGVVFGAVFNEKLEVEHMEATKFEECEKFRGSKYVQSKIGKTYKKAKKYLNDGRVVLFSGTQCQIKGLNLFLGEKYENLISVDIICHGVPSPSVFNLYKELVKKEYNSDIEWITFRDKTKGWKKYRYKIKLTNGQIEEKIFTDNIYSKGFLHDLYLRPSCYSCQAKNFTNNSDISLADYWGIQNKHPEFDDDKGVSLVLVNSKKGQAVFNKVCNNIEVIDTDLNYAISHNPCIVRSIEYNNKRDIFFKKLNNENLNQLIDKYTRVNLNQKIKNKFKYVLCKNKQK